MTQIVVFPKNQLDAKSKERLTKAGIVYVETDDPSRVVVLAPSAPMVSADDLLMSAMHGMSGPTSAAERAAFASELYRRLKAREAAAATSAEQPS